MALDFPTDRSDLNPSPGSGALQDGDTTLLGNILYTFVVSGTNSWWTANVATSPDDRYVNVSGDTMTGDLVMDDSDITLENSAGDTTIGLDASTGNVQLVSLNGGPLAGFRNQIINGDFNIWQRGTGPFDTTAAMAYTADRWVIAIGSNGMQRSNSHPAGLEYSISLPANAILQQGIELPRGGQNGKFAVGSTWTLSLWATTAPRANAEFIFRESVGSGVNQVNAGPSTAWASTGETSNGFTRYAATVTLNGTAGATNVCLELQILAAAATSNITGVQFEPGPVATPFELRPIGAELALCQRYFCELGGRGVGGMARATNYIFCYGQYPNEFRTIPTMTTKLPVKAIKSTDNSEVSSSNNPNATGRSVTGFYFIQDGYSGLTVGEGIALSAVQAQFIFDAEL